MSTRFKPIKFQVLKSCSINDYLAEESVVFLKVFMSSNGYCFVEVMVASRILLSDEDRALLLKVSSLLEELLETLDVLENEEALKAIREAEEDVKAGRVRSYDEFIEELKSLEKYKLKVTRRFEKDFRKLRFFHKKACRRSKSRQAIKRGTVRQMESQSRRLQNHLHNTLPTTGNLTKSNKHQKSS